MKIDIITSGSSGNCYRVSDGQTSLLIDAGITIKQIQVALNFKLSEISACLISHCHGDHSKAGRDLIRAGIDVYTSQGTIDFCGFKGHRVHKIEVFGMKQIGTFRIIAFDVQHDAPEPLGFLIESTRTRERLLYFTDSYYIKYKFNGLTHIMAECNYDEESIKYSIAAGYIPVELVPRLIKSHMSLEHLIEMLKANDLRNVRQIYLMHLSGNNSNADMYKNEIRKVTGSEVYIC